MTPVLIKKEARDPSQSFPAAFNSEEQRHYNELRKERTPSSVEGVLYIQVKWGRFSINFFG
jgi:hypothetical protein